MTSEENKSLYPLLSFFFSCPTPAELLCLTNIYYATTWLGGTVHIILAIIFSHSLPAALCRNAQMGIIGTLRLSIAKVKLLLYSENNQFESSPFHT